MVRKRYVMIFFEFWKMKMNEISFAIHEYQTSKHEIYGSGKRIINCIDRLIHNTEHDINTRVYKKETNTGLLINFYSLLPSQNRINQKTVIDKTKHTLQKNECHSELVDKKHQEVHEGQIQTKNG